MYDKFYGFTGKPFQLNPDPKFFYRSKGHQRAMAYLRYGLQQGQGFIVVTGDVGTGKTMLVNNLFKEIEGRNVTAAKIVSTSVKDEDLLRLVAASLGLPFDGQSKAVLLTELEKYFRSVIDQGSRVLLVVDEAQNLPRSSLEELRMLSNFDHNGEPVVQSFLLGQREFRATMRSPGLEQLRQRVMAAYHLKPLNQVELKDYIEHRLRKVGWKQDPAIEDLVYESIYMYTRGIPRRINTVMDRLLLNTCLDELHQVNLTQFEEILREFEAERGSDDEDFGAELADVDAADSAPAAIAERDAHVAAGATRKRDSADLNKIEHQLATMQHMVDSISKRLEEEAVGRRPQGDPRYPEQPSNSPFPFRWSWLLPLGIGIFVLALVGLAAVLLFTRNSA